MEDEARIGLIYKARLAEQAERYGEMASYMRQAAELGQPLTLEEGNLLSVAYKNYIGEHRGAWRVVASAEAKQKAKGEQLFACKGWKAIALELIAGFI